MKNTDDKSIPFLTDDAIALSFRAMRGICFSLEQGEKTTYVSGLSGGFCGEAAGFAADCPSFGAMTFPTVKYLRILSRRFGPSPRIASKSSTVLKAPYDLRIFRIFSAVTGPIPGTVWSSSEEAVLMLTGFSGGFFLAKLPAANGKKVRPRKRRNRRVGVRRAMAEI
jgi:hypothetical protein